jgi:hypothetical protein
MKLLHLIYFGASPLVNRLVVLGWQLCHSLFIPLRLLVVVKENLLKLCRLPLRLLFRLLLRLRKLQKTGPIVFGAVIKEGLTKWLIAMAVLLEHST